ncbi:MAG: hypothetical protein ACI86M_003948 [Saprospiraceae bacterium]|jgi:hypothetical protein
MRITLQFIFLMLFTFASTAQSSVNIQINHLLDGEQFENEVNSKNDLGNDFMIDRLQYYLSGFSIKHDGGQVTEVEDLYVLVNLLGSTDPTIIELGEYEIESLESVLFYFGVDYSANHADPSLLHPSHPLAPKFPSMHWGWSAGYRFIALEGMSGPNVDQELQFHCIGDEFYKQMEYEVTMSGESSYTVEIDAEYKNLLEGIDISSGLILHGNLGEIQTLAANISEKVFSTSSATSTYDSELVNSFEVYPNPVTNGQLNIKMDVASSNNLLRVQDALGRVVFSGTQPSNTQIELANQGMYFLTIADSNGKTLATRKVVVQ